MDKSTRVVPTKPSTSKDSVKRLKDQFTNRIMAADTRLRDAMGDAVPRSAVAFVSLTLDKVQSAETQQQLDELRQMLKWFETGTFQIIIEGLDTDAQVWLNEMKD